MALAAAYFLITMYGSARESKGHSDEAALWSGVVVKAEQDKLKAYQQGVQSVINADVHYTETIREKLVPVTKTIVERATQYAATPDGSSVCLNAERVLGLESSLSTLFPPATAAITGSVEPTVSADAVGHKP